MRVANEGVPDVEVEGVGLPTPKAAYEGILHAYRLQRHGASFAEAVAAELTGVSSRPPEQPVHPLHQPGARRGGAVGVMEERGGRSAGRFEVGSVREECP